MNTYRLNPDDSITCLQCNRTSYNQNDVREKYCGQCHQWHERQSALVMFTVYDHPLDYPDYYVVRGWTVEKGWVVRHEKLAMMSLDLESIRIALARQGLTCVPRSRGDDPAIIETWI